MGKKPKRVMKMWDEVPVLRHDLRALLHWAAFGITRVSGGAYQQDAPDIIESYAKSIRFELPCRPNFRDEEE